MTMVEAIKVVAVAWNTAEDRMPKADDNGFLGAFAGIALTITDAMRAAEKIDAELSGISGQLAAEKAEVARLTAELKTIHRLTTDGWAMEIARKALAGAAT